MNAVAAQALTSSARLARMRPRSVRGPPSDQARRSSQRAQRWKSGGKARKPSRLDFQARFDEFVCGGDRFILVCRDAAAAIVLNCRVRVGGRAQDLPGAVRIL